MICSLCEIVCCPINVQTLIPEKDRPLLILLPLQKHQAQPLHKRDIRECGKLGGKEHTSPPALMVIDSPSSPAAATADSKERFVSPAAVGVASAAAWTGDDAHAGTAAIDGFGEVACRGAATADPTDGSDCGGCAAAGWRRRRISLALGPAAGTRRSVSHWRMRSALICGRLC